MALVLNWGSMSEAKIIPSCPGRTYNVCSCRSDISWLKLKFIRDVNVRPTSLSKTLASVLAKTHMWEQCEAAARGAHMLQARLWRRSVLERTLECKQCDCDESWTYLYLHANGNLHASFLGCACSSPTQSMQLTSPTHAVSMAEAVAASGVGATRQLALRSLAPVAFTRKGDQMRSFWLAPVLSGRCHFHNSLSDETKGNRTQSFLTSRRLFTYSPRCGVFIFFPVGRSGKNSTLFNSFRVQIPSFDSFPFTIDCISGVVVNLHTDAGMKTVAYRGGLLTLYRPYLQVVLFHLLYMAASWKVSVGGTMSMRTRREVRHLFHHVQDLKQRAHLAKSNPPAVSVAQVLQACRQHQYFATKWRSCCRKWHS